MAGKVDGLMDGLRADLERLAAMASVPFPVFPVAPLPTAHPGGGEQAADPRPDVDDVPPGDAG